MIFYCDGCKNFLAMVAKIFLRDLWVRRVLLGGCSRFGLVVGG